MTKKYFYDTNAILDNYDKLFENSENSERFVLSSQTLIELENIKVSSRKDENIKYKARKACRVLDENIDKYDVSIDSEVDLGLSQTPDNIIMTGAYRWNRDVEPVVFITNDVACRIIANKVYGLDVESVCEEDLDNYTGFKEVMLSENDMAYFYQHLDENIYECSINEYLVIKDLNNAVVDKRKWNGKEYVRLVAKNFKSRMLGIIKPLDDIQQCAFDSLQTNDISVFYGKAGSGKTTIPLAYIMQNIETQKFRKCHIIYHYETLKGAKTLGYEKGNHIDKLVNSGSLGNILYSKFGDEQGLSGMIANGIINIIPTANIRGVEFSDSDVVFLTESQNLNVYTLKTIIQRCKKGCHLIIEGDMLEQLDINYDVLGIRRMIEVFKGHKDFGVVKLKNNYRSELCELADKM